MVTSTCWEMGPSAVVTLLLLLSPSVQSKDVLQCVVDKNKCMTCMWNLYSTPTENYTLYYWYPGAGPLVATPCSRYLQENGINVGCWFNSSEFIMFQTLKVKINSSSMEQPIIQTFDNLLSLVKLDPPYSLEIESTENSELLLKWKLEHGVFPNHCICYQVQHHNLGSKKWTVKNVNSAQFSLPSFNPQQLYTFQVRSTLCNICVITEIWSEWSEEITWGKNETMSVEPSQSFIVQNIIISFTSTFVLLTLLVFLIRMERIWVIIVPRIPNPAKTFEDLFKTHKGDFQEWLGISKEVVENLKHTYTEPLCSVSEDSEINGTDAKCPQPTVP